MFDLLSLKMDGTETVQIMGKEVNLLWALGVICSLCACCCSSLGFVLQKMSHNLGEAKLPCPQRTTWIAGLTMVILGAGFFDSTAYSFAPLSLLAPLAGVTIMFNLLFSDRILHEHVTLWEIGAASLIIVGATLSTLFGDHQSIAYKEEDLQALLVASTPWAAIAFFLLLGCGCLIFTNGSGPAGASVGYSFLYGYFAGQMGCIAGICLKCFVTLIRYSSESGDNQMGDLFTWFFFVTFVVCALSQLVVINIGLAKYDYAFFSMVYQTLFIMCGVIGGGIFFQEFDEFDALRWWMFSIGVFLIITGLLLLGRGQKEEEARHSKSQSQDSHAVSDKPGSAPEVTEEEKPLLGSPA